MRFAVIIGACIAIFHTPDGQALSVDIRHIAALRPAINVKEHLAAGTNTVLYVSTKTFGITETIDQARSAIHNCTDGTSE
jgi:hypothetical protein